MRVGREARPRREAGCKQPVVRRGSQFGQHGLYSALYGCRSALFGARRKHVCGHFVVRVRVRANMPATRAPTNNKSRTLFEPRTRVRFGYTYSPAIPIAPRDGATLPLRFFCASLFTDDFTGETLQHIYAQAAKEGVLGVDPPPSASKNREAGSMDDTDRHKHAHSHARGEHEPDGPCAHVQKMERGADGTHTQHAVGGVVGFPVCGAVDGRWRGGAVGRRSERRGGVMVATARRRRRRRHGGGDGGGEDGGSGGGADLRAVGHGRREWVQGTG